MRSFCNMCQACVLAIVVLGVGGCATPTWHGPGAGRAYAECQLKADMLPVTANPGINPFAVAAFQEDFIDRCMRAQGYTETYD